jgi:carbon storage regulator
MLVLSRRKDESIVLPDLGITIEVIRIKGNKVRLGIKAPDSVRILRSELESIATDFEITNPALDCASCSESVSASAK